MTSFPKTLTIGATILALSGAVAMTSTPAEARGGAVAAGVLGGLAVGAIAGSAAANSGYGYHGGYGYAPAPVYGGGCYFERRPVYDDYGEVIGHRRVRVCE